MHDARQMNEPYCYGYNQFSFLSIELYTSFLSYRGEQVLRYHNLQVLKFWNFSLGRI